MKIYETKFIRDKLKVTDTLLMMDLIVFPIRTSHNITLIRQSTFNFLT